MKPRRSILSGQLRKRGLLVLDKVARHLARDTELLLADSGSPDLSLEAGLSARALFYASYMMERPTDEFSSLLQLLVDRIVEDFPGDLRSIYLWDGIAGVAWTLRFLERCGYLAEADEACKPVDELIMQQVENPASRLRFELLYGVTGIGVYAREKYLATGDSTLLHAVLKRLLDMSTTIDGARIWESTADEGSVEVPRDRTIDLGMAHGMSSVLALSTSSIALGLGDSSFRASTLASLEWLSRTVRREGELVFLPSNLSRNGADWSKERPAWCNGGLGIAPTFLEAGRAFGYPAYVQLAEDLVATASRARLDEPLLRDGSFCHGSSGLMHLLGIMGRELGSRDLLKSARAWAFRLLEQDEVRSAQWPFPCAEFSDDWELGYHVRAGILGGFIGPALSISSAVSTSPSSAWDSVLLISDPLKTRE